MSSVHLTGWQSHGHLHRLPSAKSWALGSPLCPGWCAFLHPLRTQKNGGSEQNLPLWHHGERACAYKALSTSCAAYGGSESVTEAAVTWAAGTVHPHMRFSQATGCARRWPSWGLLVPDCGCAHLVDRKTNAHSGQGSRKEETHRAMIPNPTCTSTPMWGSGASLLGCILLHYYADILIMQICF